MTHRLRQTLCFSSILIPMVAAASGWLISVANGIAYGSLVGLNGRERDVMVFGGRAERELAIAATCEAAAIGIGSLLHNPKWPRASFAVFLQRSPMYSPLRRHPRTLSHVGIRSAVSSNCDVGHR
jgi:hypothetical protein